MNPSKYRYSIGMVHSPDLEVAVNQNYGAKFAPVWAYTLASYIPKKHYVVELFDLQSMSINKVSEKEIFLFSGINQDIAEIHKSYEFLKTKYPKSKFLIGGPICWSLDKANELNKLDVFDHICIGDGELMIASILDDIRNNRSMNKIIREERRFDVGNANQMDRELIKQTQNNYFGSIVEVSRGCPFLCEFCDIRVMNDNNRSHNFSVEYIINEVDYITELGVNQITFACDNFIGDLRWAEKVVDALIEWSKRTGKQINIYTWLTINVYKHKELLRKMRQAGFELLFLGIESFNKNALLETAKVQNTVPQLINALREIQSFGFIIIAGLIIGFDSDKEDFDEVTLDGLLKAGLISGDPNFLTALPGTPLYRRMKLSGRLRDAWATHGGIKYQTNIKYILDRRTMIDGFQRFVSKNNDPQYQYARFKNFINLMGNSNHIALSGSGFGDSKKFLKLALKDRHAIKQLIKRLCIFLFKFKNLYYLTLGFLLIMKNPNRIKYFNYFQFWAFAWTNSVVKYGNLTESDFDVESISEDFDYGQLVPDDYRKTAKEMISFSKIKAQQRISVKQLEQTAAELKRDP